MQSLGFGSSNMGSVLKDRVSGAVLHSIVNRQGDPIHSQDPSVLWTRTVIIFFFFLRFNLITLFI